MENSFRIIILAIAITISENANRLHCLPTISQYPTNFCLASPSSLKSASDLTALSTQKGKDMAKVLREILDELRFDVINGGLRDEMLGGDYETEPFPLPTSKINIPRIRLYFERGARSQDPSTPLQLRSSRPKFAVEFFMFGTSLSRPALEVLFGRERVQYIQELIDLGLLIETPDHKIRMNGLSLACKELPNGEVIYILADTPPYFETRMTHDRVYLGGDSYNLTNRILQIPEISGYCVEGGSGSGIQLIAVLKQYPNVRKAIGLEIDLRAIHVSIFNAALNGVENRMVVVEDAEALREELGSHTIDFAMTNPPFLAMPAEIDIGPEDRAVLSEANINAFEGPQGLQLNLRRIHPKAGWGGEDGLAVTREIVDILLPLLGPFSQFIIYSQFAGDPSGPTKIQEYLKTKQGVNFKFERLELAIPAQETAKSTASILTADVLFLKDPQIFKIVLDKKDKEYRLYERFTQQLAQSFQRQDITHFHSGFIHIEPIPRVTQGQRNILDRIAQSIESGAQNDEHLRRLLSADNIKRVAGQLAINLTSAFPGQSTEYIVKLVERIIGGKPLISSEEAPAQEKATQQKEAVVNTAL